MEISPRDDQALTLSVDSSHGGERLDSFLCAVTGQSRAQIQKLISKGFVLVNGSPEKKCHALTVGDSVILAPQKAEAPDLEPRPVDFGILHEDEEFLVVDKPAGLSVHPAPGQRMTTLVHGLLYKSYVLSASTNPWRPGIVHRLDRFTSGVIIVAKNVRAHAALSAQFAEGGVEKEYLAMVEGVVEHDESLISAPISRDKNHRERMAVSLLGKAATTFFKVKERYRRHTLLVALPKTGRRHQIRVHARHMGHPLVSDALYALSGFNPEKIVAISRQALHARRLKIRHPSTGHEMEFISEIPPDFAALIEHLEGGVR